MKKAIVYYRVSDRDQLKGLSVEVQRNACIKWAKENEYQIEGIYGDEAKTGTQTVGRHGFEDAIIHCQEEKTDALLVIDSDRFARNEEDHFASKVVLRKYGTQIIAVNQPMIDESAEGRLMETVLVGINAFYSRLTGRKVKKSLEKKWEDGIYPSWAPLGYTNVNKGTEEKPYRVIEIDPIIGPLVKELFKLYSTGNYSYFVLCQEMFKKGLTARKGKVLSDSSVQQILSNTFYYGWMRWSNMEKQGIHKPLISKILFNQCHLIAAKHRQFLTRQRKHDFLLRSMVLCSKHNSRLTAEWHLYHNDRYKKDKIGYYHCYAQGGCPGSFIEVDELEKRVANLFKNYQFSQEFIDLVTQKVKEYFEKGRNTIQSERQVIINKRKAVEVKRDHLEDLLTDGEIGRDVFKRQHERLQGEIDTLDNDLAELESQRKLDVNLIDEILALTGNIYQTYVDAPAFLKKHYLRLFFEAIYVNDQKISKVVETPIFAALRRQNHIIIRTSLLPDSRRLRITISTILKAFEDIIQVELLKVRWEEIKRLQTTPLAPVQA